MRYGRDSNSVGSGCKRSGAVDDVYPGDGMGMRKGSFFAAAAVAVVLFAPAPARANHDVSALVSTGPAGGNGASGAVFRAASEDGSRVLFQTSEQLVAADTDAAMDLYQRSNGVTTLVSTGSTGGNGPNSATFAGASHD